jgi:hypothetical protein
MIAVAHDDYSTHFANRYAIAGARGMQGLDVK